jgi:hypothetical protein
MRVLTGTIFFNEEDWNDSTTSAEVYDAHWVELSEEELDDYSGDWIHEGYQGTIIIHTYLEGFFK